MGSLVTVNSTTDIKARLTIARHATLQLTRIWKAKDCLMLTYNLWSTALYRSENWPLKKYKAIDNMNAARTNTMERRYDCW